MSTSQSNSKISCPTQIRSAFTLIELLVVIAIIALLIGILLPALGQARDSARNVLCKTNLRSVATASMLYADDYRGQFPPVLGGRFVIDPENQKQNMVWYDVNRIGRYLPQEDFKDVSATDVSNPTVGGTVMSCPNHPDAGRSYTMNYWASSAGEYQENFTNGRITVYKPGAKRANTDTYQMGKAFNNAVDRSSDTILFSEAWGLWISQLEDDSGERTWFSAASMGSKGLPGERFGALEGIDDWNGAWRGGGNSQRAPEMESDLDSQPTSYVPYYRHPNRRDESFKIEGNANIAFADGHVGSINPRDLFEEEDGRSTYKALWSPDDEKVDNRELGRK